MKDDADLVKNLTKQREALAEEIQALGLQLDAAKKLYLKACADEANLKMKIKYGHKGDGRKAVRDIPKEVYHEPE